jgi:hypothetical protein
MSQQQSIKSHLGYLSGDDTEDRIEQNEKDYQLPVSENTLASTYEKTLDHVGSDIEQGSNDHSGLTFTKFMTLTAMSFLWYVASKELKVHFEPMS